MKRSRGVVLVLLGLILVMASVGASDEALETWLEVNQLGPYATETQDWDAIIAAAQAEGEVTIYSSSSRIYQAADTFFEEYGIWVNSYDMGSAKALDKAIREQEAGVYNCDVLFTTSAELTFRALPEGLVYNFVPDTVGPYIPDDRKYPLLLQRTSGGTCYYNTEQFPNGPEFADGTPVDNLWDLTRPEWRGSVLFKNPLASESTFNYMSTVVGHAEEMKAAYEKKYGELVLSPGVPDAGFEWLYRLMQNDPVLVGSSDDVVEGIGTPVAQGNTIPKISSFTSGSKIRYNQSKGYVLGVMTLEPAHVILNPTYLMIPAQAPHPNAAKLLIRWLMGSAEPIERGITEFEQPYWEGESARMLQGRTPWFTASSWAPMTGYPIAEGCLPLEPPTLYWYVDEAYIWEHQLQIQEAFIMYGG
ncbi:MAG: ABC transporter substrate-binding protein [Candidatus Bipolaricaulota bacterium]|nr:MAG: ABC transporter substrate-binding protein [Candidatus Bipolaricaulota bacterium]